MTKLHRCLLALGALALLLATALGAYGTHALRGTVSAESWEAFRTALEYQFYHGLGLIAVALVAERCPRSRWIMASGGLLVVGLILFCGSIIATTLGAPASVGAAAPIGGTCFMGAWLALAVGLLGRQGVSAIQVNGPPRP